MASEGSTPVNLDDCLSKGKKLPLKQVKKKSELNISKGRLKSISKQHNFSFLNASVRKQTLRENNRALAQSLAKARVEMRNMHKVNKDLLAQNQDLVIKANRLKRVAGMRDDEIETELQKRNKDEVEDMKKNLDKLRQKCQGQENQMKKKDDLVAKLEDLLRSKEAEKEEWKKKHDDRLTAYNRAKCIVKDGAKMLNDHKCEIIELKAKISELENTIQSLREQINALQGAKSKDEEKIKENEAEMEQMMQSLKKLCEDASRSMMQSLKSIYDVCVEQSRHRTGIGEGRGSSMGAGEDRQASSNGGEEGPVSSTAGEDGPGLSIRDAVLVKDAVQSGPRRKVFQSDCARPLADLPVKSSSLFMILEQSVLDDGMTDGPEYVAVPLEPGPEIHSGVWATESR